MAAAAKNLHFWKEDETLLMLTLLKDLNILKYMDGRKTRNGDLFKRVSEMLKEGGYVRTPEQIRIRWKHLKKTYYEAKKKNSVSGHNRVTCPFGDALEELLATRPLSQVDHHGVDIGFESPLDISVQEAGGLDEMPDMAAEKETETESESSSRPQTPHLPRPSGRRRHVSGVETVLERMQEFQATWMQQMQQSQEREERLLNTIMDSNSRMVAAVMEGIRSFQQFMAPPTRNMGYGYQGEDTSTPHYHHM